MAGVTPVSAIRDTSVTRSPPDDPADPLRPGRSTRCELCRADLRSIEQPAASPGPAPGLPGPAAPTLREEDPMTTATASAHHDEAPELDLPGTSDAPTLDPVDPAAYLRAFRGETLRRATTALAEGGAYVTTRALAQAATPHRTVWDAARWWRHVLGRRRPSWSTEHRIVWETPIARLRDFTAGATDDVVPTLVLPPQAGHDSCIVDFAPTQSQMQVIRQAGLTRAFTLDWVGATQATKTHDGRGLRRRRRPRRRHRRSRAPATPRSTSSGTARAAGSPRSTRRCTPSGSTRSPSPGRPSTSTPARPPSAPPPGSCPAASGRCPTGRWWPRAAGTCPASSS